MRDKKLFYRERIWECGCYTDVEIFPVYQKAGVRRAKCNPSSEVQAKLNEKNAIKKLTRLLHLNFTENDLVIGLDYTEDCKPFSDAQMKSDLQNYLRRIKRLYDRFSEVLKYIAVSECSETGRAHFHITINKSSVPEALIRDKWSFGRTEIEPLQFDENGVVGWSRYITKSKLFAKRWCASRNLKQPTPRVRDYSLSPKKIELFRIEDLKTIQLSYGHDVHIVDCSVYNNDVNRADYIYIQLFDLEKHIRLTGKKRYERKIKKDKSAARTGAQKINC